MVKRSKKIEETNSPERGDGEMHPAIQDMIAQGNADEVRKEVELESQEVNTPESIEALGTLIQMATKGIPLPGVEVMRVENEMLGAEIKATRTQWAATGIGKTKKRVVIEMLVVGTTKTNIVKTMGITPTACNSLFGDVRAMGLKIDRDGDVYSLNRIQLRSLDDYSDLANGDEELEDA